MPRPRLDQLLQPIDLGAVAGWMRHGQLHVRPFTGVDDFVRLGQTAAERLFHVHVDAPLGGRHGHVAMLVEPPLADRNDVGFRLVEHLLVIGESALDTESFLQGRQPHLVVITDANNLDAGERQPGFVHGVSVIPSTGSAHDGHAILLCHVDGSPAEWVQTTQSRNSLPAYQVAAVGGNSSAPAASDAQCTGARPFGPARARGVPVGDPSPAAHRRHGDNPSVAENVGYLKRLFRTCYIDICR
ncbi:MAG: hypothetical protein R3C10_07250 [Pirellulales bacterium]